MTKPWMCGAGSLSNFVLVADEASFDVYGPRGTEPPDDDVAAVMSMVKEPWKMCICMPADMESDCMACQKGGPTAKMKGCVLLVRSMAPPFHFAQLLHTASTVILLLSLVFAFTRLSPYILSIVISDWYVGSDKPLAIRGLTVTPLPLLEE